MTLAQQIAAAAVAHEPRCRNCQWWDTDSRDGIQRICRCPKCAQSDWNSETYTADNPAAMDAACPDASDDYGICLLTGPDFGCVHFAPRTSPPISFADTETGK